MTRAEHTIMFPFQIFSFLDSSKKKLLLLNKKKRLFKQTQSKIFKFPHKKNVFPFHFIQKEIILLLLFFWLLTFTLPNMMGVEYNVQ